MHLEEIAVVNQPADDPVHVHRLGRVGLGQLVHSFVFVQLDMTAQMVRRVLGVVRRAKAE